MDGVIFQHTNFWMQLHKAFGTLEEGVELTKKYLRIDYLKLVKEVIGRLWKGKPSKIYLDLVKNAEYNKNVKETIEELRKKGYNICLITSGPYDLAKRASGELGIEHIYANKLLHDDKIVTGEYFENGKYCWEIGFENKLPFLEKICEKLNIKLDEVIAIGNDDNDLLKFEAVGMSIAFNTTCKELRDIADAVVEGNDLKNILKFIP